MEIDLRDFGGPLPVLPAQHTDGQHESYLAVLPGEVLADIYDRWGARLLEQNVRVFLQARGKVNRGIRLTLENEPSMFFAYNNGITATAEAVDISNGRTAPPSSIDELPDRERRADDGVGPRRAAPRRGHLGTRSYR